MSQRFEDTIRVPERGGQERTEVVDSRYCRMLDFSEYGAAQCFRELAIDFLGSFDLDPISGLAPELGAGSSLPHCAKHQRSRGPNGRLFRK